MAAPAAPAKRRSASPLIAKLKEQAAKANKRAGIVRKELSKSYSWPVKAGLVVGQAFGGSTAGAIKGFLGTGWLGNGVALGLGTVVAVIGCSIPGAVGAAIALGGGGMLAKCAGDGTEYLVEGWVAGRATTETTE